MILAKIYNKKHIKTFLFSLLGCILIYRIYAHALSDQTIHILQNDLFSQKTADLLSSSTTEFYTHAPLSRFLTDIKISLPFITTIHRRWLPSKTVEYTFSSQEPLAKLNNSLILLQDGMLCDSSFFNTEKTDSLYACVLHDSKLLSQEKSPDLSSFVKNKLPKLYEIYHIVWYDKTYIALHKRQGHKETLYITADLIIDNSFFKKAEAVHLLLEKSYKKTADMRYKDYIVISA